MSRLQRTSAGYTLGRAARSIPSQSMSSRSMPCTISIQCETIASISLNISDADSHFPATPRSIHSTDHLPRPSGIFFEIAHIEFDPYWNLDRDLMRRLLESSRTLLLLTHSFRTSAICIAVTQLESYNCCAFPFHPWFPSMPNSRIHVGSRALSRRFPSFPQISVNFPSTWVTLMSDSAKRSPSVSANGETSGS